MDFIGAEGLDVVREACTWRVWGDGRDDVVGTGDETGVLLSFGLIGDDWELLTADLLAVEGPPGTVCCNVKGGMEELRVAGNFSFACEFCSSPRTSLREIFGPVDAPCHGDLGTALLGGVDVVEGIGTAAGLSAWWCCCFLRSRCDNLPVEAPATLSDLIVCDKPRESSDGRLDAAWAMMSFISNFNDEEPGVPHGLSLARAASSEFIPAVGPPWALIGSAIDGWCGLDMNAGLVEAATSGCTLSP